MSPHLKEDKKFVKFFQYVHTMPSFASFLAQTLSLFSHVRYEVVDLSGRVHVAKPHPNI